jgi:hypothetical protein
VKAPKQKLSLARPTASLNIAALCIRGSPFQKLEDIHLSIALLGRLSCCLDRGSLCHMSRIEFAIEKVKRLNETQAEALLEWLEQRESREALRQKLDAEIEVGLTQLRRGEKIPGEQVHAEIGERSRQRRAEQMPEFLYSPAARLDLLEIWEYIARDNLDAADRVEQEIKEAVLMPPNNRNSAIGEAT